MAQIKTGGKIVGIATIVAICVYVGSKFMPETMNTQQPTNQVKIESPIEQAKNKAETAVQEARQISDSAESANTNTDTGLNNLLKAKK